MEAGLATTSEFKGWCFNKDKTRKATGFKSLRINFWNITQAI